MFGEEKATKSEVEYLRLQFKELRQDQWDMEHKFILLLNTLGYYVDRHPVRIVMLKKGNSKKGE